MSTPTEAKAARKPLLSCRPRSRAEAKEASRESLIAAAMALFAEKGLDVSLDEVCAKAGYTRGAFYVHFRDRDELIAAVMDRVGRGVIDSLIGEGDESLETVMARFSTRLASGTHALTREGGMRPYQLLDACARSPAIRKGYVALMDNTMGRLARILGRGQKGGAIRSDVDPRHMATLLEAVVLGLETMHDVEAKVDLQACARTLLILLQAPAPAKR
jgi:TetR/AcrR family transcriptional repressor of nem operon